MASKQIRLRDPTGQAILLSFYFCLGVLWIRAELTMDSLPAGGDLVRFLKGIRQWPKN